MHGIDEYRNPPYNESDPSQPTACRIVLIDFPTVYFLVLGIIFVAATVRATLGFGDAVLAMPLLTLLMPPTEAAAVMALCSLMIAAWMTCRDWRDIAFDKTWRLLLTVCLGMPIGVFFLKHVDPIGVKAALGIVVVGFAVFRLRGGFQLKRTANWLTYAVGFVTGVMFGAFNILGVILAMYGSLCGWDARRLRMTLQGVMLPAGVALVSYRWAEGSITLDTLKLFAYTLPLLLIAGLIGQFASHRVNARRFEPILTASLFIVGGMLLISIWIGYKTGP
ncbi:MAG: sulfite exporter TauE/SafE family protein [Pirellulaceae bacterium]